METQPIDWINWILRKGKPRRWKIQSDAEGSIQPGMTHYKNKMMISIQWNNKEEKKRGTKMFQRKNLEQTGANSLK